MLDFLRRLLGMKPAHFVAPTTKQLGYAKRLGVNVPKNADRAQVSTLISAAEAVDPNVQERKRKQHAKLVAEYGQAMLDSEAQWSAWADANKWAGVVYRHGKSIKAEVLRLNGASIECPKKLLIEAEVARVKREAYIGEIVDVGRGVELNQLHFLWWEIVGEVDIKDVAGFRRLKEKAEKMARNFG
jgi:hypothetical protein